jgi:triacylglycerol lipase
MGGLDSRVLIAADHPGLAGRIVSLTTLSTPHHGSPLADLLVGERPSFFSGLFSGSFSFGLGSLYDAFRAGLETVGIDNGALKDLKEKGAEATPDVARTHGQITYRSYAGSGRAVDPRTSVVLRLGHKYILGHPDGGPNDGAVAVKSAEYGTFKGTWPCDHLDMVGHDLDKPGFAQGDFNHLAEFAKIMDLLQAEHPGT